MHESDRSPNGGALTIEVERDGATLLISPRGELDISTTQALDVVLRKGIDGDAPRVILDLRGVSFIDSTGLRLLVFAASRSRSNGDRLRMMRGSEAVERVLLVSGLEQSLPFLN
jgi:anti-anti-sigma factor